MFLEYQRFLIRTLAAAFDLSPMNFGVDADVNRNQGEVNGDRDWNQAIKPCASQISSHLTRDVLHQNLGSHNYGSSLPSSIAKTSLRTRISSRFGMRATPSRRTSTGHD